MSDNVIAFRRPAKNLFVRVTNNGEEVVAIEMPAGAIQDIEYFMSPESVRKVAEMGYDLSAIKKKVIDSGLVAQTVLDIKTPEGKHYKVWLGQDLKIKKAYTLSKGPSFNLAFNN